LPTPAAATTSSRLTFSTPRIDWLRWAGIADVSAIRFHHPTLLGDYDDARAQAFEAARDLGKRL